MRYAQPTAVQLARLASVLPSASIKHGCARWGSRQHGYLPRGAASRMAGPRFGLRPAAGGRGAKRNFWAFVARAIGIALGSAGGTSLSRVARSSPGDKRVSH